MRDPALFPISLSNQEFSTENVMQALPYIFERHDKVIFLVADHLQIYNKALRLADGLPLKKIVEDFTINQKYLDQRTKWIERITARISGIGEGPDRWAVIGIDDIADSRCYRIFRNVMLAYYSAVDFRDSIDQAARDHAEQRNDRFPMVQREYLSRGYLLEEVALSLRIHVIDGIDFEYYLARQSTPILNLYQGRYSFSPFDLAEVPENGRRIRLYFLEGKNDGVRWAEYE